MLRFLLRRLLQSMLLVCVMGTVVFFGVYALGDPTAFLVNPQAPPSETIAARERLGLDLPLYEQYFIFVKNALKGDFGNSFIYGYSATAVIIEKFPATLELTVAVVMLALVVGVPLGMIAGFNHENLIGRSIMSGSILGFSLPSFWIGLMLMLLFSVYLGVLPATGRGETVPIFGVEFSFLTLDGWSHLIMPMLGMGIYKVALVTRLARAGVMEVMEQDYIKFAYAKGLKQKRIISMHVLKNIMIPIVTVMGMEFASILAFAVVTETVFAWPGMGKLIIDSIILMDRPIVVAYLMIMVVIFITVNFIVDVIYAILDPRIRLTSS